MGPTHHLAIFGTHPSRSPSRQGGEQKKKKKKKTELWVSAQPSEPSVWSKEMPLAVFMIGVCCRAADPFNRCDRTPRRWARRVGYAHSSSYSCVTTARLLRREENCHPLSAAKFSLTMASRHGQCRVPCWPSRTCHCGMA